MSTYNGEKYVHDQIVSILKQTHVTLDLIIRDDGSQDQTCKIIENIQRTFPNVHLIKGGNLGYTKSFFELIFLVGENYHFYGFADQDDVWFPSKVNQGVSWLLTTSEPALYACRKTYTDANLSILDIVDKTLPLTMEYGFFRGGLCGCTMMWNRAFQHIILKNKPQTEFKSHDDYIRCLAISLKIKTYLDERKLILYRRHNSNQSLLPNNRIKRLFSRGIKSFGSRRNLKAICSEILSAYGSELKPTEKYILKTISQSDSFCNRLRLCSLPFKTIPSYEIWLLRLLVLLRGID